MFNNEIFDSWLNKKSDEILSKVDRERISTEEMIVLVLKAQTNHFHHMDIDVNKKFEAIDKRFEQVDRRFEEVDRRFEEVDRRFDQVDVRLDKMETRLDRLDQKIDNRFMWMIGITIAMSGGIYLKLFLG